MEKDKLPVGTYVQYRGEYFEIHRVDEGSYCVSALHPRRVGYGSICMPFDSEFKVLGPAAKLLYGKGPNLIMNSCKRVGNELVINFTYKPDQPIEFILPEGITIDTGEVKVMFTNPRFKVGDVIMGNRSRFIGRVTAIDGDMYDIAWLNTKYRGKVASQHIKYTDVHFDKLKNGRLLFA